LVPGPDGYLWRTTYSGGLNSRGTIYTVKADASGWQMVLAFSGNGTSNKGGSPNAGLLLDASGFFWGTTQSGGALDYGTVFKFTDNGATNKGRTPLGGLAVAADGWLWGCTYAGGAAGYGTI
jgi:uncharacterized repeat protein (TIGR03803 family)